MALRDALNTIQIDAGWVDREIKPVSFWGYNEFCERTQLLDVEGLSTTPSTRWLLASSPPPPRRRRRRLWTAPRRRALTPAAAARSPAISRVRLLTPAVLSRAQTPIHLPHVGRQAVRDKAVRVSVTTDACSDNHPCGLCR
jgi:hypothetical protein